VTLLAAAVIEKARRVRQMFDAQAPNELLWAHDELADALNEYDESKAESEAVRDGSITTGELWSIARMERWKAENVANGCCDGFIARATVLEQLADEIESRMDKPTEGAE